VIVWMRHTGCRPIRPQLKGAPQMRMETTKVVLGTGIRPDDGCGPEDGRVS
jgi:hypothetical protein